MLRAKFASMKVPAHVIEGITGAFVIKMLKKAKAKGGTLSTVEKIRMLKDGK